MPQADEDVSRLLDHRRVWEKKPYLRRVYQEDFFRKLSLHCRDSGPTVEIGSGPGFFKAFRPDTIATDILFTPWVDAVLDGSHLPFKNGAVGNLVGLDVLHHLSNPIALLREGARVLQPGGRMILLEPWLTPLSKFIYRHFHEEACDVTANPHDLEGPHLLVKKEAFAGNQALPYLLFGPKGLAQTLNSVPGLHPLRIEPFSLFTYLLSFGFKDVNALPAGAYPLLAAGERLTSPLWRRWGALRVLLVLEKNRNQGDGTEAGVFAAGSLAGVSRNSTTSA